MGMCCADLRGTWQPMSSAAGDEGQGGQFGAKGVRTCRLTLEAIVIILFYSVLSHVNDNLINNVLI